MPEIETPFIQGEVQDTRFPINLFLDPLSFDGENAMVGTPGMVEEIDLSAPAREVRGMLTTSDGSALYVVVYNKVYRVTYSDGSYNVSSYSLTLKTSSGQVWMAKTLSYIVIVDEVAGYYIDTATPGDPAIITSTGFVVPSCLTAQDSYFIVGKKDTFYYQISSLNDGSEWSALDLGTVEGNADPITSMISDHRQVVAMGGESGEVLYNSGATAFPFERYPDIFIEDGIGAPHTIKKIDNSLMYLNRDFLIKRLDGFTPKVVSPANLNSIIAAMQTKSDSFAFVYSLYGHIFYTITFPSANISYCYDASTGLYHQWSSGLNGGRHRSNCYAFFNGKHLVGDYEDGKIYRLDPDTYTDRGEPIKWQYTSPSYEERGRMLFHKELEIAFEGGVGITTGQGSDPVVVMRYSDDGMKTWSNESWKKLGKIGKYKNRVRWARLGGSRGRIYELSGTDPVDRKFKASIVDIEVGRG